jgi:hypothetical protein
VGDRQRVDDVVGGLGADLHQAQLLAIGMHRVGFAIDRDARMAPQFSDAALQIAVAGNVGQRPRLELLLPAAVVVCSNGHVGLEVTGTGPVH